MTDLGPALTLGQMLDRAAARVPDRIAVVFKQGVAANCLVGSTQVLMNVFDPVEAMRLIEAERVTIFSGVPTMFITVLGHPAFGTRDLRSLRTGSIGAAPVPVEIMRRILDRERGLGMDALVVYGLTEATGGTHWDLPPKKWTISDLRKGADLGSS